MNQKLPLSLDISILDKIVQEWKKDKTMKESYVKKAGKKVCIKTLEKNKNNEFMYVLENLKKTRVLCPCCLKGKLQHVTFKCINETNKKDLIYLDFVRCNKITCDFISDNLKLGLLKSRITLDGLTTSRKRSNTLLQCKTRVIELETKVKESSFSRVMYSVLKEKPVKMILSVGMFMLITVVSTNLLIRGEAFSVDINAAGMGLKVEQESFHGSPLELDMSNPVMQSFIQDHKGEICEQ